MMLGNRLSENFTRIEFRCKCEQCKQDTVDVELISILERVRNWADDIVHINSANRCPIYNKAVGGSTNSQHLRGRAADIVVEGKSTKEVYDKLNEWYPDRYGMGLYATFTHVDSRTGKARWKG